MEGAHKQQQPQRRQQCVVKKILFDMFYFILHPHWHSQISTQYVCEVQHAVFWLNRSAKWRVVVFILPEMAFGPVTRKHLIINPYFTKQGNSKWKPMPYALITANCPRENFRSSWRISKSYSCCCSSSSSCGLFCFTAYSFHRNFLKLGVYM